MQPGLKTRRNTNRKVEQLGMVNKIQNLAMENFCTRQPISNGDTVIWDAITRLMFLFFFLRER